MSKNRKKRGPGRPGVMKTGIQTEHDMLGWPGTLPPRRMRTLLRALNTGRDPGGEQVITDGYRLADARRNQTFSATVLPELTQDLPEEAPRTLQSAMMLHRMTKAARRQDTSATIGGLISRENPGRPDREQAVLLRLSRHPEWIGLNAALPMMKGLHVIIHESGALPGQPGLLLAEPPDNQEQPGATTEIPGEEAQRLAGIARWHGARMVWWKPA